MKSDGMGPIHWTGPDPLEWARSIGIARSSTWGPFGNQKKLFQWNELIYNYSIGMDPKKVHRTHSYLASTEYHHDVDSLPHYCC